MLVAVENYRKAFASYIDSVCHMQPRLAVPRMRKDQPHDASADSDDTQTVTVSDSVTVRHNAAQSEPVSEPEHEHDHRERFNAVSGSGSASASGSGRGSDRKGKRSESDFNALSTVEDESETTRSAVQHSAQLCSKVSPSACSCLSQFRGTELLRSDISSMLRSLRLSAVHRIASLSQLAALRYQLDFFHSIRSLEMSLRMSSDLLFSPDTFPDNLEHLSLGLHELLEPVRFTPAVLRRLPATVQSLRLFKHMRMNSSTLLVGQFRAGDFPASLTHLDLSGTVCDKGTTMDFPASLNLLKLPADFAQPINGYRSALSHSLHLLALHSNAKAQTLQRSGDLPVNLYELHIPAGLRFSREALRGVKVLRISGWWIVCKLSTDMLPIELEELELDCRVRLIQSPHSASGNATILPTSLQRIHFTFAYSGTVLPLPDTLHSLDIDRAWMLPEALPSQLQQLRTRSSRTDERMWRPRWLNFIVSHPAVFCPPEEGVFASFDINKSKSAEALITLRDTGGVTEWTGLRNHLSIRIIWGVQNTFQDTANLAYYRAKYAAVIADPNSRDSFCKADLRPPVWQLVDSNFQILIQTCDPNLRALEPVTVNSLPNSPTATSAHVSKLSSSSSSLSSSSASESSSSARPSSAASADSVLGPDVGIDVGNAKSVASIRQQNFEHYHNESLKVLVDQIHWIDQGKDTDTVLEPVPVVTAVKEHHFALPVPLPSLPSRSEDEANSPSTIGAFAVLNLKELAQTDRWLTPIPLSLLEERNVFFSEDHPGRENVADIQLVTANQIVAPSTTLKLSLPLNVSSSGSAVLTGFPDNCLPCFVTLVQIQR